MTKHAKLSPLPLLIDGFIVAGVSHQKPLSLIKHHLLPKKAARHMFQRKVSLHIRQNPFSEGRKHTYGFDAKDYIGTYPLQKANSPQFDDKMIEHVQTYIDTVWQVAEGKILLVEERVDFSDVIGVDNQFDLVYDFKIVRLFIHQPGLNHVSEQMLSFDELKDFGERAKLRGAKSHKYG